VECALCWNSGKPLHLNLERLVLRTFIIRKYLTRVLLAGLALFALSATAIVWDGLADEIGNADVAIVLGNTVEPNGQPSARLQARLDKTVELYQQGWFANIIVSGGIDGKGHNEAEVMKRYLAAQGIPENNIYADSAGNNTYLTAKNAARFMQERGLSSAIIITQYFHVPRAKLALERFGVSQVYSAHANFFEARDVYSTAREVIAFCTYLVRSYN